MSEADHIKDIKVSQNPISTNRMEVSQTPIPSKLCSSNQSGSLLTNQDSVFWTNEIVIWSLHLHEDGPIRDQGQELLSL